MNEQLYIVVPCYNEEAVLPETVKRLAAVLDRLIGQGKLSENSRVTLVDDGSRDATWAVITALTAQYPAVEGLKLSHNAGHQNALWAGMMTVKGKADAVVTIDADLQDDPEAIDRFVDAWQDGYDVVYGVREKRDVDTAFKRMTAQGYYRVMKKLGADLVYDHADYRLLSRRALDALSQFGEVNLFLRGMVPLLGFPSKQIPYVRGERFAGESKYPLGKMLAFAMQGITSFSVKPIRFVFLTGIVFALLGVFMALYALISLIAGAAVPGWTSIMISVWLIGGVQLVALGLIGEYIGKIYTEVKRRPRFIAEAYLEKKSGTSDARNEQ